MTDWDNETIAETLLGTRYGWLVVLGGFVIVGTAGNVSTGAIDELETIAAIAREHEVWFHVDGAYGAPAACLPEAPKALESIALADSVALDPHKWLYAPIEAACTLVRDPEALRKRIEWYEAELARHGLDVLGRHGWLGRRDRLLLMLSDGAGRVAAQPARGLDEAGLRGALSAVGSASAPPRADLDHGPVACVARAEIRDVEGEVVAILRADWQVGLQTPTPANPLPETGKSG